MLATSVRVRPCSARCSPRSVGRRTSTSSPSWLTCMSRWMRSESSPLGPLTVTRSGSMAIVTPVGTGIGCLPILDIASLPGLPDPGHDLASHALMSGVVAGHDPLGGGDDRGAHAALDAGNVGVIDVRTPTGPRHALDARDHGLALV